MPNSPNRLLRMISQTPSPRTSTSAMTQRPKPASATLCPRLLLWARRCARPDARWVVFWLRVPPLLAPPALPLRALVRDEAADERVFFFPELPDDFDCAMYQIPSIAFAGRLQRAAVKPLHTSCM